MQRHQHEQSASSNSAQNQLTELEMVSPFSRLVSMAYCTGRLVVGCSRLGTSLTNMVQSSGACLTEATKDAVGSGPGRGGRVRGM